MRETLQSALGKTQRHSTKGVEQILDKKLSTPKAPLEDFSTLWELSSFGLAHVDCLQKATPEVRTKVRHILGKGRFLEAYYIEKAGMSFAAKMSLLARSLHEQKMYSLFSAEEASHFHFVEGVLGEVDESSEDPFIALLNEMITHGNRAPLLFMIQVVLEGWGIDHYSLMMKSCLSPELKTGLQGILNDEAAHHGSGLSLFDESELSPTDFDYIIETMMQFLTMVRVGPVGVMSAMESAFDGLSSSQNEAVLEQMQARLDTTRKLTLLKNLMLKARAHKIVEALEGQQGFELLF